MIGQSISHYRIIEKLGAGGMGEVYRAEDSYLHRQVAIKVLPDEFAQDPERLARFQREAQVLASLNHPNIAAIHGLEESGGKRFIVMELVEGETIAERLLKGPLPVGEALRTCREIAEGLGAAHDKGVVHRDLKPANVMITADERVKILDFGLAKARTGDTAAVSATQSPTVTEAMTRAGTILGTAAYMSPEQAKGKAVDRRADIWAFGCILFECLTGTRAFPGETIADTLASILTREPDWESLPASTPDALRKLLRRTLHKNPHERVHDIADIRIEIDEALQAPPRTEQKQKQSGRGLLVWLLAGVLTVICVGETLLLWRFWAASARSPLKVERTTISLSASGLTLTPGGGIAISPDGQKIVFPASDADGQRLYLRQLDSWEPRPLKGTEGAESPFFSPDGDWVAFFAGGKLQKTPLGGGPTEPICTASIQSSGGIWTRDGRILFGQFRFPNSGIWGVAADGRKEAELVVKPREAGAQYHSPELLPSGNAILFMNIFGQRAILAYSFGTGEIRSLIDVGANPRYVQTGHLLYQAEGSLRGVAFDPETLQTRGPSRLLADGIGRGYGRGREYDISATGTLVSRLPSTSLSILVWKDRSGKTTPVNLKPRNYSYPTLSPDGRKIAVNVGEGTDRSVWISSTDHREPLTRLSFDNFDWFTLFTPDGRRVFFTSGQTSEKVTSYNVFWTAADASTPPEPLTTGMHIYRPTSCSPDGQFLLLNEGGDSGGAARRDVAVLDLKHSRTVHPFLQSRFDEQEAVFSPDGRYVAYQSNESGRMEIYVQPYPGPGAKERVSLDGGQAPAWSPRGDELFFQNAAALMAVRMDGGKRVGTPTRLFTFVPRDYRKEYDVSPDGQRFLMLEPAEAIRAGSEINVITNWFEELERLVPTRGK